MAPGNGNVPDWRDADAYEPLLHADRSLLAWEWLRRDGTYRAAAERALEADAEGDEGLPAPGLWGLHAFEPPYLSVPDARPVWRAEVHPHVLAVHAVPQERGDAFDLRRLPARSRLLTAADCSEHLLISDGVRTIRMDVLQGSLKEGRVRLRYLIAGLEEAEKPLLALRRLLALWRTGRFSAALHPAEARRRRLVLMLRAHDALSSGASQREIAAGLLSARAGLSRWRTESPTLRSSVQRLVRNARALAAGGYLSLLRR